MTYKILILSVFCSLGFFLFGQNNDAVKKAIQLGDSLKFEEARILLQTEIKQNPTNADAYYWLGRYAHFLVYDARPFMKKSDDWSKKEVIANLTKATALKPNFGDAYYFIAAEYGCRAREALKLNNVSVAKAELKAAKKAGGFPEVELEYARCILNSCDKNAILFTNWDAPGNSLMYVQLAEGLRKDISVIIVNLLDRPYYIKLFRNGISNEINKVPISWNDNLILDMHSYFPWKEQLIEIKISPEKKADYKISDSINKLTLLVKDKYGSGSMWIGTAAILNILENNKFVRPIYTALPYEDDMFEFTDYLQNQGFVSKLMPYKTNNEYDTSKFEASILNGNNYKYFNDIKIHNQPRADYFFGDNRRNIILDYIQFLLQSNKKQKAKSVYEKMNSIMPPSTYALSNDITKRCKEVEKQLLTD
jgi:hypothetical protein